MPPRMGRGSVAGPARAETRLRLSLFTVPDISIGRAPLTPQNSQVDPRRLEYLDGMIAYLNGLFRHLRRRHPRSEALARLVKVLPQLPYSELVRIDPEGPAVVAEVPGARDRLVFHHDRLKIALLDGLHRGRETPTIPAGRQSPMVSRVLSRLARGVTEDALSRGFRECGVDLMPVIQSLRGRGLVEEVNGSSPLVPPALQEGKGDRLAWLGHAGVLFQTARASICVDPFLRPHIRWTEGEARTCFSRSFGDRLFFEPYGPGLDPLSPAQLPPLDAVFVTHQDIDHCNLGVLMMLPEEVPIVVPDCRPDRMWEVDLAAVIRRVLGPRRKVVRLRHGETITIGDIRATAFPFRAEMPSSLPTLWNCYLFETGRSAVACTADAALTDESVEFLARRLGRTRRPFALCARPIHSGAKAMGYRDEVDAPFNFTRLWGWYLPVWDLFQPVEELGISESRFRTLCRLTNLRFFLPYAMGTAPWYRIPDVEDPLYVPMGNLSARDILGQIRLLEAIPRGPALFPGRFAEPFPLADA